MSISILHLSRNDLGWLLPLPLLLLLLWLCLVSQKCPKEIDDRMKREKKTAPATNLHILPRCLAQTERVNIVQVKFYTYNYLWFDLIYLPSIFYSALKLSPVPKEYDKKIPRINDCFFFFSFEKKKEMLAYLACLFVWCVKMWCISLAWMIHETLLLERVNLVKIGVDFISLCSIVFFFVLWLIMMPSTWHFTLPLCVSLLSLTWIVLNGHQHNLPKWFDTNNHN